MEDTALIKRRVATLIALSIAAVFLIIIVQNPTETTLDLLFWTVSIRQGFSLWSWLSFLAASLAGSAVWSSAKDRHRLSRKEALSFLFPDFSPFADSLARRGIEDSSFLCERLLYDTGVALLPGVAFHRSPEELTARMAYVNFDGAKALAASEILPLDQPLPEDFIDFWCEDVIEATQRIVAGSPEAVANLIRAFRYENISRVILGIPGAKRYTITPLVPFRLAAPIVRGGMIPVSQYGLSFAR